MSGLEMGFFKTNSKTIHKDAWMNMSSFSSYKHSGQLH